ncbi:hypothetical protein [Marinactinospora rubrisoli]|uniref:Uncharacterized protein n=1 Tax=Marinactinospora rubrisoli TaxID=2715399 RepID=A0ABW2KMT8_9ACTN
MGTHGNPDQPADIKPGGERDGDKPSRHGSGEPMPEQSGDGTRPGQ